MAVLPIRIYPDPVLRVRCAEVTSFDDELAKLIADMVDTMHGAPGVGLAASQVGVERRVAVVDLSVGENPEQLLVLVNPMILSDQGSAVESEGCLSIPELTEKVERPERLEVMALDAAGAPQRFVAEGWLARAIAHEIDHLDGVLFVDHLHGLRRERARRALRKLAKEQEQREWDAAPASSR